MPRYKDDLHFIPFHMHEGMLRYIEHGVEPGSFLKAVLMNDMMRACEKADSENQDRLFDYARYLYCAAPRGSFGSPENVAEWMAHRGLAGIDAANTAPPAAD